MSFGFSVGDFVALAQLAYTTVQNSRKACGAHGELTREVTSLHIVLQRLQREVEKPDSLINRIDDGRLEELQTIVKGCDRMLKVIDQVLNKYNGMSEEKRRVTRFRLKVQFGNGEMKDIGKIRQELATYTSAITLFLNLLSLGSQGKVEEYMERNGDELRELRQSLNWITATLQAGSGNREGSILTSYGEDDKAIWKEFRRELLKEGFSSDELREYKVLIKKYVMELGARGALDAPDVEDPIIELKDKAEETVDAGKGKEVRREVVSVLESTPLRTGNPVSSLDGAVSTLPLENGIDGSGQLVENKTQGLSSPTQLKTLSKSASQISMNVQQVDDYPMTSEQDEAKDSDQEIQGDSTLMSQENNTSGQPAWQSEQSSDSNVTSSEAEEETTKELTTSAPDTPHCGISIQYSDNKSTLLLAIGKTRITPKPVSIEEVKDEDLRSGAHPNCEAVGIMTDEYGDVNSYSDEDTIAGYRDDDSDEDDFLSPKIIPEDWRTIPAPLWREVERTRNSPRIVDDFEANGSGEKSRRLLLEPFGHNLANANSVSRPGSPSGVAESWRAHAQSVYTMTPQPGECPAPPPSPPAELPVMYTLDDIVEQYGFDPFRSKKRGISEAAEWEHDISRLSLSIPGSTMELSAAAVEQIPEDPDLHKYRSSPTPSTTAVHSRCIERDTRKPWRPGLEYSEWQEESARRDWTFPRRSTSGLHEAHEYSGPDESRIYAGPGAKWTIDPAGRMHPVEDRTFSPRHTSTGYYQTSATNY